MRTNLVGRTITYDAGGRVIVGEIVLVSYAPGDLRILVRERGGGALRSVPSTSLSTVAIDPPESI